MKKITVILMGLIMIFGLSSCVTAVHAQDDSYFDGEVDATVVISYGTPYIVNNMIEYYFYRGWYYYPRWTDNSYYFHRYRRPLPSGAFYDWYRPIPAQRLKYHRPGHGYYHKYMPRHNNIGTHVRRPHGHMNIRPNTGGHSRPKMGGRR
jgi:hypothetical protein